MTDRPFLTQFRLEDGTDGIVHLVFDCPGRTMNVFSNAAIEELGRIAAWLAESGARGLVIRSGKANAFCAGADLTELGLAYDEIMAAPRHARFIRAASHFFRLSAALRALETAGKPIAAAIAGLALGGGCELALAAHHRVLVDDPKVVMGLPESLVGLFPGGGGTQRLPRLIGLEASLPVLLDGARLAGVGAIDAGVAGTLCAPGEEIVAAEAWVRHNPAACQPWDREDYVPMAAADVAAKIAPVRAAMLEATLGHYPAPLAILDCLKLGLPQRFDLAIRSENAIFADLIQRREPRNMIRTMFVAKTEYDRQSRKEALSPALADALAQAGRVMERHRGEEGLLRAGFFGVRGAPVRARTQPGYWLDEPPAARARAAVAAISDELAGAAGALATEDGPLFDYAVVSQLGFPAYLGGPLAFLEASNP